MRGTEESEKTAKNQQNNFAQSTKVRFWHLLCLKGANCVQSCGDSLEKLRFWGCLEGLTLGQFKG